MPCHVPPNLFLPKVKRVLLCLYIQLCALGLLYAQPANDNCSAAEVIPISNNGFGTGVFTSSNINIGQATVQPGEAFAPAIMGNGQDKKSIWFKFSIGTSRQIRVTLQQPTPAIAAGDVGFAVYKASNCLPVTNQLSTQLTPIGIFGNTFHPCTEPGDYLVQVSGKTATTGLVSIQVNCDYTGAIYDRPATAYNFGTLSSANSKYVDFPVECQSLDDASEICTNPQQFTKSTWHTFTTPAYLDWLSVLLASPTGSFTNGQQQTFGFRLYKGDVRTTAIGALVPVRACDSLKTTGNTADYRIFKCGEVDPSSTYSIQLFYKQSFSQDVRLAIACGGGAPTIAPQPIASAMGSNLLGAIPPSGAPYTYTDYLACNSRHAIHPCGDALPAAGINYSPYNNNFVNYNLSTFYSFTLTASANLSLTVNSGVCNSPYLLIRLYRQAVDNNCATLTNSNLIATAQSYGGLTQDCLQPGSYTIQIMGQEAPITNNNYQFYYATLANGGQLCMLSNMGQKVDVYMRLTASNAYHPFALNTAGAYDKVNNLAPLQNGVSTQTTIDAFGCAGTVLPDTLCPYYYTTPINKAMYRQFTVADSGTVVLTDKRQNLLYKMFRGDADALATQQNKHSYPDRLTGLVPVSECLSYWSNSSDEACRPDRVCVLPGTYTYTTLAGSSSINVQDKPTLKFEVHRSLHGSPINAQNMGSLLDSAITVRTSDKDYFSCTDNAVPINGYTPCFTAYTNQVATKAIYRQFYLKAESIVSINSIRDCFYYNFSYSPANKTLFSGKATDGLAGLQPLPAPWRCFENIPNNICTTLPAGWYTVVSYGVGPSYQSPLQGTRAYSSGGMVGAFDQFTITITPPCPSQQFNRPYKASVDPVTNQPYVVNWPARFTTAPSITLAPERFNCSVDTPFVTGIASCSTIYNRASYYVFKVINTTSIAVGYNSSYWGRAFAIYALDVRTDSVQMRTATPVYSCASSQANQPICQLPPGTYTLVLFASDAYNCSTITPVLTKPCNDPYYNRPYKAAVDATTGQPFLIDYTPGTGHTTAYPKTDVSITLPTEYFTCQTDTPFSQHPLVPCVATANRVAYYVFKTVRETYVQIDTKGYWGAVYPLDVRTDSAQMLTRAPVQPCVQSYGFIQLCRLPAGTYTLVVFAENSNVYSSCVSVVPTIYVDQPGYSRFDRAAKAYDFDVVPADNAWHNGKTGDVNPIDPGRAPSSDLLYCTTGSSSTDPTDGVCGTTYNPRVYSDTSYYQFAGIQYSLIPARRNLWYTFVVNRGGTVRVKVENKTPGKLAYKYRYTIYRSDVNGNLPFGTVVSTGQVDSTNAQGLRNIVGTYGSSFCYDNNAEVTFSRDPCSSTTDRYYILVETPGSNSGILPLMQPNSQVDVSILVDPASATPTQFDHYSQAANMGAITSGSTVTGPTDNLTCATRDATDPVYDPNNYGLSVCTKNVWYKFTTTVSGNILYRMVANSTTPGGVNGSSYFDIQLFREVRPGDSTRTGLQYQGGTSVYDAGFNWMQTCVAPGTYYLLLPGCSRTTETVYPVIKIVEQLGDFCSKPVVASLGGAGSSTTSVKVDCHTIGTDYGEFNPQLSCPANTPTNTYKSSWFRVDIGGTDTLDITAFLNENTSATSAQIKYRMMTGNCGAMQEQSCVLDALTQNTYKCLTPGSYFFQVFSPIAATGTIDLKLNAVKHVDTCAPVNNCLATASFLPQFDCNTADSVRFVNYSTYGSAIQYSWTFGYNGQTATDVSPSFFYPALPAAATYNVKLVARNTGCNKSDTVMVPITIPGRPYVNLGNDTSICNGSTLVLNATSHPGATYEWTIGSPPFATTATTPTITTNVSSNNFYPYAVKVTYGNCTRRDTIRVFRSLIAGRKQNRTICNNESVQLFSSRGNGSNETYLWSTGATTGSISVSTAGTYYCDIKVFGCAARDTFIVQNAGEVSLGNDTAVCIRPGRPFVLNATTAGAISYLWQNGTTAAIFSATAVGQYWVKINFGNCFVQDTINLTNLQPTVRSLTASLCAGKTYILPSGQTVGTAGIYTDTARAIGGCDSVITTTTLVLKTVLIQNTSATICQGQTYTLPWGTTAATAGNYRDTLRSPTDGCDSIIRTVALAVVSPVRHSTSVAICAGQTYTLPSGVAVTTAGAYSDTLRYVFGCDSLITTLSLTVKTAQAVASNHSICPGQLFTLPSGRVVNTAGTFYDTLHYVSGCDSIRYTINLIVGVPASVALQVERCSGIAYSLPSGRVVYAAGIYYDTLRHQAGGCDSLHYTITRTNRQAILAVRNVAVCAGQSYTLPSGAVVTTTGIYPDTLRYTEGCDSLIATYTVTTKTVANRNVVAALCAGQSYTLPSGTVVSTAGLYNDTLRYAAGCDSIITRVNLQVQQVSLVALNPTICQGNWFTMPSGKRINTAGVYKDTLRSVGGCDSVLTTVTLTVTPKPVMGINLPIASVCIGDSLLLKAYGGTTYKWIQGSGILSPATGSTWIYPPVAGVYRVVISEPVCNTADTFQSTVRIEPLPKISVTKSNDVSCVQGAAQLIARGGATYTWWPATGLNYTSISNPIALPATNTVYHVRAVSSQNCVAEDSIAVKVIKGDVNAGFLVPSAFTPNTDGSNDCFGVRHWGAVTNLRLSVYDRKGLLVFSTTDPAKCWDGRYKGEPLATAAYVYFITANTICGPVERKGTILLIR